MMAGSALRAAITVEAAAVAARTIAFEVAAIATGVATTCGPRRVLRAHDLAGFTTWFGTSGAATDAAARTNSPAAGA
jgi:hypothetical protein